MLQGTVKSFDPDTKAAVVLTDTREEYQVPPEAFRSSGLLRLTLGQRVKFRVEGEGVEVGHTERAVQLALASYCSVAASLATDIVMETIVVANGTAGSPVVQSGEPAAG